ncbi:YadA family autotransporter adhesin [Polaromonas vacuolata]|uniref:YadA family autotransporter adhesin n=1 Tax=Polaromonas vacuolata TaxID=37448 RepID=UPI0023567775|nr:YadA-like family protein [Polaromonas vacuolata]
MSTALAPLVASAITAIANGGSLIASTAGGVTSGMLQTQGATFNNTDFKNVPVPEGCSAANGVDTTVTGLCANAGTSVGVNGATVTTLAHGSTAYGSHSLAQDANTTAIGFRSTATFEGSVAIGFQARAIADPATAVGANSLASGNDSVALGASAQATGNRSVALGAYSVAEQANTVSVGSVNNERRITNVAAGIQPTDGVNVSQLRGVQQQTIDVARIAYSGIAMSMAMAGNYMPNLDRGEKALGIGIGNYRGYSALGINFKALNKDGQSAWGLGVATTRNEWSLNVGTSWRWR